MKLAKALGLMLAMAFVAIASQAAYLPIRSDIQDELPLAAMLHGDDRLIEFEVQIPGLELTSGTLEGKRWDRAEIPGGGFNMEFGRPEVPHFSRLLAIPARAAVRLEFEALETEIIPNIELMPAQGDEPEELNAAAPIHFDMSAYSQNAFYPEQRVKVGEPAVMRGVRLVPVQMSPVQYNPVTKELRVVHRFRVKAHFEGQDLRHVPNRKFALSPSWANMLSTTLINPEDLEVDQTQPGSYLIICENDATLLNNLASFVDWKKRKGHSVTISTFAAGASTTAIKNLIQTAYNTWEIPPEYVLLFGDTSGDYALPGWSPEGVDHPYSQLDGGDILADVAVGRLPAENAIETMTMINKVLFYEKMPFVTSSDWYHQSVLTAGSGSGSSPIQTNRWIKTRMIWHNYTRIDTMWYTMGGSISTTITNAVNNGVTYYNFRGYLYGGLSIGGIDGLTNGRRLPFCTDITCGTGGFDDDSQMEHWVSVGTPTTPKGAIAAVGTATWSTNTRCNNTIDVGIYAGLFDEDITQAGNALNRGKLELYNAYQTNSSGNVSNFSLWNALAGDPGVDLYTGAIRYLTCDVPGTVNLGDNSLSLTVTEAGVGPVEEATACAYKSGELQAVALTDANGQVTLPINVATAGNIKVTITKHNYYPIVDSLDVVQQTVTVGYYSHTIDDDNSGGSSGNGDGIVNPGEVIQIPLVFKNYGSATTATGISATASESDAFATLAAATQTFPNLAPGATGNSSGSLLLTVAADCPEAHAIRLNFATTSAQGSWDGLLDLNVASYLMTILSATASGSDTLLSPGETANLIVTVRNNGSSNATTLTATIISLDTNVTVNDNSAAFGTVNIGAAANCSGNPFNLTAAPNAPMGHEADLAITFSANGATQTDTITLQLGLKSTTDPQGPDEYGYYCYDNTDLGYAQVPAYNWVEIDPSYGGAGTQLSINDPGEDQDQSVLMNLPFTFRYYGQDFNSITVCSNGWISTIADVSYTDFRNFPIPSATGPTGQICAFWDDLITWGSGRVFAWNDAVNHRLVIEWSRLKNLGSPQPQETFEIILYDPIYYPTPTGDGEILFQYNSITEVVGNYDDNGYSTIGIESPDRQDGIQVVYWNTYQDPAAAHVQNGRAYKFTTAFAQGGEPPVIGINPTSLTINAPLNGSGSSPIIISNSGAGVLTYSTNFLTALLGGYENLVIPGIPPEVDAQGGPDQFGYTWVDSDEPGGPTYGWVDISATGTLITFPHNDSTSATLPIGFDFPFYGQMRSSFIISANGWVSFTSHSGAYNNTTLPNPSAPPHLLAGFWDDLDPLQAGAQVRYWSNNSDSLVVSFLTVPHWGTSVVGTYTFQMIVTSDGGMTYQYQTLTGNYNNCTVGIQNDDGTDGLQVAYNQAYLHNNLAVQFYHPFLRAIPPAGAVPPGGSQLIAVTAFSYGLTQGNYPATMVISSNDPITPTINVPVTVVVGGTAPSPVDITLTPVNPPILIPASGGSFSYNIAIQNVSAAPQTFDVWIMTQQPNGAWRGPMLGPVNLTLTPGSSITRTRNQNVPGSAMPGVYAYIGYVGAYSTSTKWDSSYFNYTKLSTGDGESVNSWDNWGESFDPWMTTAAIEIPKEFALLGAYPNPFNAVSVLSYQLPVASHVSLKVFDMTGRLVAELANGWKDAGVYQNTFDASGLASGIYVYRLTAGSFNSTGKMVLLK